MTATWKIDANTTSLAALQRDLLVFLRKRVAQTYDAEDLLSQIWIQAGRLFEGRSSLRHYLFILARSKLSEYYRALRRPGLRSASEYDEVDALVDEFRDLELDLRSREDFDRLQDALVQVPEDYRIVVELVLRGYSNFEIVRALELNYNTVRSRYSRGKAHLARLLAKSS